MSEPPKDLVPKFFDSTALTYDKIIRWTTFGKDKHWKKEIVKKIPPSYSILDLACGTGILTREISEKFPDAKIVGVDVTESYLEVAKKKLKSYQNIFFVNQDAEKLNLNRKFDCITSSYLAKYCRAEVLIKSCLAHLKPGGKIILHDFIYPKHKAARKLWNLYFVMLGLIGYFFPTWKEVFVELPKLIRSSNWVEEYETVMKKHGLLVEIQPLTESSTILTGNNVV
ncbi:MAG: class I SAM-dependent methyltransferase [Nitrosopumilaceae archaeon]